MDRFLKSTMSIRLSDIFPTEVRSTTYVQTTFIQPGICPTRQSNDKLDKQWLDERKLDEHQFNSSFHTNNHSYKYTTCQNIELVDALTIFTLQAWNGGAQYLAILLAFFIPSPPSLSLAFSLSFFLSLQLSLSSIIIINNHKIHWLKLSFIINIYHHKQSSQSPGVIII